MSIQPLSTRRLRVAKPTLIERMVIREQPYVVTNPLLCDPNRKYLVHLDPANGTATITEAPDA